MLTSDEAIGRGPRPPGPRRSLPVAERSIFPNTVRPFNWSALAVMVPAAGSSVARAATGATVEGAVGAAAAGTGEMRWVATGAAAADWAATTDAAGAGCCDGATGAGAAATRAATGAGATTGCGATGAAGATAAGAAGISTGFERGDTTRPLLSSSILPITFNPGMAGVSGIIGAATTGAAGATTSAGTGAAATITGLEAG